MKQTGHLCILLFFLAFIYIPPVLWLSRQDEEVSQAEKRKLARLPVPEFTRASLSAFPKAFEEYYKDHFGLRHQFIVLNNALHFNILKKSPLPLVTVGQDDWLFYNGESVLPDFLGQTKKNEEFLEEWKRVLEDREEWLADQGIRYLLAVAPNKMMVYPEKLPARIERARGRTQLDAFREYLEKRSRFTGFIDLREPLHRAKDQSQVYYRTDTHWNPDGALVGYGVIMKRVREWFPEARLLPEHALARAKDIRTQSDISIMLNLKSIAPEESSKWVVRAPCAPREYGKVDMAFQVKSGPAGSFAYRPETNGCPGAPLTAVMTQDSFGQFLHPFLNESFGRIIYSDYVDLRELKPLLIRENPDLIIELRVARHLPGVMQPDPEVERTIMDKHYNRAGDRRLRLDARSGHDALGRTNELSILPEEGGLLLQATGSDPSVELTFDAETGGDPLLVRVSLISPAETLMQLFYATPDSPQFTEENKISKSIARGENNFLFRLPHPRTAGRIRFDPGAVPGRYLLKSLEIIREERTEP